MAVKDELWGAETRKAVENFPVSGQPIPAPVARWLGRIKAAAARVNAELGLLDADKAERIAAAADRVAAGELDDQFPIDVFQTGSGTSSNMNANEVIAALAGEDVHANDDVNMGQSSNDVFPSAVHLAALDEATNDLLPALDALAASLERKAERVRRRREVGPHAPHGRRARDARPGVRRLRGPGAPGHRSHRGRAAAARPDPARRHGRRHGPQHASRVRRACPRAAHGGDRASRSPRPPIRSRLRPPATRSWRRPGALKTVAVSLTKIANDLRLMGSGPRAGLAEIFLPELQKGSSIMPGKVNPVIPEVVTQVAAQVIGNDAAITVGGMQGHFELNVFVPLMARNLLDSIELLASAARLFAEKCVDGIEANREACERYAELTLSAATALNPYIGYDKAAEIVKEAAASGRLTARSRPRRRCGRGDARRGARLPPHGQAARGLGVRRSGRPPRCACARAPTREGGELCVRHLHSLRCSRRRSLSSRHRRPSLTASWTETGTRLSSWC